MFLSIGSHGRRFIGWTGLGSLTVQVVHLITYRERGGGGQKGDNVTLLCAAGHVNNTDQTCKIMYVLSTIIKDRMDRSNNSWVEMWTDVTLK